MKRSVESRLAALEKRVGNLEKVLAKQVEQVHTEDVVTEQQLTEWRSKGGAARAEKLSPERRREIAAQAGKVSADRRRKAANKAGTAE